MRQILPKKYSDKGSLEKTINESIDNINKTFRIDLHLYPADYSTCCLKASSYLNETMLEAYKQMVKEDVKMTVRAIYITRKLSMLEEYDDRFELLSKYSFSPGSVNYALSLVEDLFNPTGRENPEAFGYYQHWAVGYVKALINTNLEEIK